MSAEGADDTGLDVVGGDVVGTTAVVGVDAVVEEAAPVASPVSGGTSVPVAARAAEVAGGSDGARTPSAGRNAPAAVAPVMPAPTPTAMAMATKWRFIPHPSIS
ncbi:MAG: hypothetical protein ACRDWE_14395, partial [Acidimicrobiales bacterium]